MKFSRILLPIIFILFYFQSMAQVQSETFKIDKNNEFSDLPDSAITITTIDGIQYRHSRLIDWNVEIPLNMMANPICVGDWEGNRNIEFAVESQTKIDKFYIEFYNVGMCSKVTYETWPVTISNRKINITFYYPNSGSLSGTFDQSGNYISGSFNFSNSSCGGSTSGNWNASPVNPCEYPPDADFSGSPTSGIAPLDVKFTNKSTGTINSRSWDFGDGGSSTLNNPSHVYLNPGIYTVSLTVTGPGGSDTKTRNDYINVMTPPPIANFIADTTFGIRPLTVQFTDSSMGDITSWDWDFGDGESSSEQHPEHTYDTADTFTVSLTVTGPGGSDTKTRVDYIIVTKPPLEANFVADTTHGPRPLTVQFTDSSKGDITSWYWDFGDSESSSAQHPLHTYNAVDTFTVSLTVTGPGGSDTKTRVDYIIVSKPALKADFVADTTHGPIPLTVQFTDSSKGDIIGWYWDFGDGESSSAQHPLHTYNTAGTFTVSLTVTDPDDSDTKIRGDYIIATVPAPVADFVADTTSGPIPLTVQFTDNSTGDITSWLWDFGDTQLSSAQHPLHTFNTISTFTVALTVTGPGGSDNETKDNYIVVTEPTDVDSYIHQTPTSFVLHQNFPNPFNPSTMIKYCVKEACQVKLTVYNIHGQTIQNLVDTYQEEGVYRVVLNTVDLASGIYFYQIQMGDFIDIKKMAKVE